MRANPLLPVLASFDAAYPWPSDLDATGVQAMHVAISRLVDRADQLAVNLQTDDSAPAELIALLWSVGAGRDGSKILRAAKVDPDGDAGSVLWLAVCACLMVEEGRFHTDRANGRGPVHSKAPLNRALAIAEWIGAYRDSTPVTAAHAAHIFTTHPAPPNWRWEHRPTEHPGADGQDPLVEFTVTRSAEDHRSYERITVTGRGAAPVEIIHSHIGRTTSIARPSWPQLCTYLAETYGRFYQPPTRGESTPIA